MSLDGLAIIGFRVVIGGLLGLLLFALLRVLALIRQRRRSTGTAGTDTEMLSEALEDAIARLKAQERATAERAEASERLSGEIISSLTSGLLVVGLDGAVRIMNPAARRLLDLPDAAVAGHYHA